MTIQLSHQERGRELEAQAKRIVTSIYVLVGIIAVITLVWPPGFLLLFPCGAIMGCIMHEHEQEQDRFRKGDY